MRLLILNNYDIELMKITGWCKNIPAGMNRYFAAEMFSPSVLNALLRAEIVHKCGGNSSYRLHPAGYRFLTQAGYDFPQDAKFRSEAGIISRRCSSAMVLSTFYRTGVDVFISDETGLRQEQTYLPSFTLRRGKFSKGNIANSMLMRGVYRGQESAYMVFYVQDPREKVNFTNEQKTFNQLIERSGAGSKSVIFMGNSYVDIERAASYEHEKADGGKSAIDSYAAIFKNTGLPVFFIPIGDRGARLLKVLQLPNYREEIARAVMRRSYKPPYRNMPDTDTVHNQQPHYPAVFGLDMDIKRIDRAYEAAIRNGHERIAIYALLDQKDFLTARYGVAGKAEIFYIRPETLTGLFPGRFELQGSPREPYVTPEGRYVDVTFSPPPSSGPPGKAPHQGAAGARQE